MTLALCMIVKDEINRIEKCLEPIINKFDQVIIVDTGSTDGTIELLKERFGINPLIDVLQDKRCLCKADVRNKAFSEVKTDWILTLDADERLDSNSLEKFKKMKHEKNTFGYFGKWINHIEGSDSFEDYKLFLFRKGLQKRGLIHENIQVGIRNEGLHAEWLDGFHVEHFPETKKMLDKTILYKKRLVCALKLEPEWSRYHWFLGYMHFQAHEWDKAIMHLSKSFYTDSKLFPVERLNSGMVLIEIFSKKAYNKEASEIVQRSFEFYNEVQNDFEVIVNKNIKLWLEHASILLENKQTEQIVAYRFAR